MIKLNLLPPEEKQIITLEKAQRWIVFYGSALIGICLVFITLLGATWLYVYTQSQAAEINLATTQTSLRGQDLKQQQNLIQQQNIQLAKINLLQKQHKYFSPLLISLAAMVPDGVRLEGVSIKDGGEAALSGFAQKREQFLIFKETLEKSPIFNNVVSPLSNLTRQTDVNFSLQLNFKPESLNK